jgi:hypothetical protein
MHRIRPIAEVTRPRHRQAQVVGLAALGLAQADARQHHAEDHHRPGDDADDRDETEHKAHDAEHEARHAQAVLRLLHGPVRILLVRLIAHELSPF